MSVSSSSGFRIGIASLVAQGDGQLPAYAMGGDPVFKAAGVHTPAETVEGKTASFWSAVSAALDPETPADERTKAEKRAKAWGIADDVTKTVQAARRGKDASATTWLLEFPGEGAAPIRRFPIGGPDDVEKAANALLEHRDDIAFDVLAKAADTLLTKAAEWGTPVPHAPELEKIAGRGHGQVDLVRSVFTQRAGSALPGRDVFKAAAAQPAATVRMSREDRIKVAAVLYADDKKAGIRPLDYRSGRYLRPEDALFPITSHVADSLMADKVASAIGSVYTYAQLGSAPWADLEAAFGPAFVGSKTAADLVTRLPSLSQKTAARFDEVMSLSAVRPVLRKVGANQFRKEALAPLAQLYFDSASAS